MKEIAGNRPWAAEVVGRDDAPASGDMDFRSSRLSTSVRARGKAD
jgi:hypothetical protein